MNNEDEYQGAGSFKLVTKLLKLFSPDRLREEIEGDLAQKFEYDRKRFGERRAKNRLLWNTIRFIRPGIILRNKINTRLNTVDMIQNYFKIAFRNSMKQKSYTLLNVAGLSLGIAASLLIFQYVKYERSFDKFHNKSDDIYRIQYNWWQNGKLNFESAVSVPAVGRALKDNFPEVREFTRLLAQDGVMAYQTPGGDLLSFHEQKMHYADTSFFKIFDFGLIKGDPRNALRGLNKVVISERAAGKYFGSDDPMGKRLTRNGKELYEVTGVFKDVPENSHIKFDLLLSYETLNKRTDNRSETHWGWYDFYTFVLLKPGTDVDQLQKKWDAFVVKTRKEAWDANSKQEFILRPLNDIHLNSHLLYESQPSEQRDGESVYALSIIAIFILVIAWVNYINLATARSFNRANEVGVRKVMGAFKAQLIGQFLTESFILNLAAAGVAILIVRAGWSPFSDLAGSKIPLAFFNQLDFWWIVMILFLIGSFLSGFYPAIILSSFKPVAVLKGKMIKSTGGTFLRQSLVIFQFAASIFLIVGSVIVYQQVNFMKGQDLGVSIDETLVLKGPGVTDSLYDQHFESFRNEVLKVPGVKSLTSSSSIPGDEIFWTDDLKRLTPGITVEPVVSHAGIDFDYVPSFGIKVIAGRNFSRDFPHDHHAILLNRAMSEILEFKDPQASIGEKVTNGRDTLEIIGVLENYHQMSLQSEVAPMVFVLSTASSFYALKIESKNYKEIIRSLNQPWESFFPGNPLDYFFLDQFYGRQYEREDRFGQVFNLFTGLAIFIAALGLFGLASFMALQRTKEIGIRKVLGSSVPEIVVLLSRSFLQPVLLANLIAWPLAWWVMDKWLTSFPYRIDIHPGVFILSGLSVGMIAFLSVSSQTLKAALIKPAETLKHE